MHVMPAYFIWPQEHKWKLMLHCSSISSKLVRASYTSETGLKCKKSVLTTEQSYEAASCKNVG